MLAPKADITPADRARGLRNLLIDAAAATAIGALNSGVVLLALALHIGASNIEIGIIAAIPLLTQMLQAPTVTLVERLRTRKRIAVIAVFTARLALPVYAMVPFIPNPRIAALVLIAAALLHYGLNAVTACSWNSWIRDLVPAEQLGKFFGRRLVYGTGVSTLATIAAAIALDYAQGAEAIRDRIFAGLYLFGFVCGLISTAALARVPEPEMRGAPGSMPLARLLWEPLRQTNFRNMLRYVASWQFAVNLAMPFFTVYFVRALGYSMSFVLVLTVVSQLANVAVVRTWGELSDRFTNKTVLSLASPLFIACIAGMALTSSFDPGVTRSTWLIVLHIVMGAAGAGVGLASSNIVMKLSPAGAATSFMAASALVSAIAAGTAPMVGGLAADFFARRQLSLRLEWSSPSGVDELFGLALTHWEFFFVLSAAMGLYSLHRLSVIQEPGAVDRREVVHHIWESARRTLRNASSVAGLRLAVSFPGGELIKLRERERFLLEDLYDQSRVAPAPQGAMGELLNAAFGKPGTDGTLDELIARLDRAA
jgi:MFS family permease